MNLESLPTAETRELKRGRLLRLLIGLTVGSALGIFWPKGAVQLKPIGTLFIQVMSMAFAPLLIAMLVNWCSALERLRSIRTLGIASLISMGLASIVALMIGLAAANFAPWTPNNQEKQEERRPIPSEALNSPRALKCGHFYNDHCPLSDPLQTLTADAPRSIFAVSAIAQNNILFISLFGIFIGLGIRALNSQKRALEISQSIIKMAFEFVDYLTKYAAPLGLSAALAVTLGECDVEALKSMAVYVIALCCGLGMYLVVLTVVMLFVWKFVARSPVRLWTVLAEMCEPAVLAFTSTSSVTAMPRAVLALERLGIQKRVVYVVLPIGFALNLAGSALFLTLAYIFVTGGKLSFWDEMFVLVGFIVPSKTIAGLPGAAFPVLVSAFCEPNSGGLIADTQKPLQALCGIDAVMDMFRTFTNVVGNCLMVCIVAAYEHRYGERVKSSARLFSPEVKFSATPQRS